MADLVPDNLEPATLTQVAYRTPEPVEGGPESRDWTPPVREVQPAAADRLRVAVHTRTVPETDWSVEDHVCGLCLGRILGRAGIKGREFMCADCGKRSEGAVRTGGRIHPAMCACGTKYGTRDAGVRCIVNLNVSPEVPQAIIASQEG